jgi:fructan beta-fructosidase
MRFTLYTLFIIVMTMIGCRQSQKVDDSNKTQIVAEKHRPALHFTPDSMWMNDPNGMVYYEGEYHLFYQYYPDSTVWGPMHWGHAVSKDMIAWEHLPIALYPDSLGLIFSGSAVIDWKNTSGFGKDGRPPMIAIFTHHNMDGEKAGRKNFQYQSIAYSNDKGRTWTKYSGNPVIPNLDNIKDFRDPKVIWHPETNKWIMALAARDRVKFYTSPDLKSWTFASDYGIKDDKRLWECPDLFPIKIEGTNETKWVLVVSMQSGAPNVGTGTSYFVGDFDGQKFTNTNKDNAQFWLDHGTDNYAMVSWSDVPATDGRRLMMGWMSNWLYAQKVPTERWRSAMTLPREVRLVKQANGALILQSKLVREFEAYRKEGVAISLDKFSNVPKEIPVNKNGLYELNLSFLRTDNLEIIMTSSAGDTLLTGYDATSHQWYIDRSKAGESAFHDGFASRHTAPCLAEGDTLQFQCILDHASIELFADNGLTTMTDIFFPKEKIDKIVLRSGKSKGVNVVSSKVYNLGK